MEDFVCDNAKTLWKIFEKTGSVSAYMLFSAIQYGKYQDLYTDDNKNFDEGMEL